jgi:LL-diaminopimelate aminotransferase
MQISLASRIRHLAPYLFADLDRLKREVEAKGIDVISMGIGDPDLPTPSFIVESLRRAAGEPKNHRYPDYQGLPRFRAAVAQWYRRRFGVSLDPDTEVCALLGSKEGIAHFALGVVDLDDIVLVPDPSYPVYRTGAIFAGGRPYAVPLTKTNGFRPEFEAIPQDIARRAKLLWLNYPNNPTAATVEPAFFAQAVRFCLKNEIVLAHDAAYSEISYEGYRAPSVFEVEEARECAVEFHSLSKTFSMTGWRLGFAVGNAELIGALGKIKTNVDSGVFQAIQEAGITALESDESGVHEACAAYQERRDLLVDALRELSLKCETPRATFYIWAEVPKGYNSMSLAMKFLKEAGVVITPGSGFGKFGEGFVRFSFTLPTSRLREAVRRMKALRL